MNKHNLRRHFREVRTPRLYRLPDEHVLLYVRGLASIEAIARSVGRSSGAVRRALDRQLRPLRAEELSFTIEQAKAYERGALRAEDMAVTLQAETGRFVTRRVVVEALRRAGAFGDVRR